jgi:predicted nucleotidyltransferase component of viral defense system
MNLLEKTVDAALERAPQNTALRPAVEKELLHYDILREKNKAGFLKNLTFIGGTCLRDCYGSERLSEDLDFSGGFDFKKQNMAGLGQLLKKSLESKYDAPVSISEPVRETGNTSTWKIKVITRPERPDFPAQKINIDICALPSYDRKPVMLKNHYGIESGVSGLILYAESLTELLADKMLAAGLRPNRVKNRDLWDMFWLERRNTALSVELVGKKLADRNILPKHFLSEYSLRIKALKNGQAAFLAEMRRFLAPSAFEGEFASSLWWEQLLNLLESYVNACAGL